MARHNFVFEGEEKDNHHFSKIATYVFNKRLCEGKKSFATETIRKETKQKTNFTTPWHQNQFSGETVCRLCVNFLVFTVSLRNESCGQELRFNYYVCSKISMDTEVVMLGMIVLQKIYPRRLSVLHAYRLIAVL